MKQYLNLVKTVLAEGTRKENRTGIDTLSYFGAFFRHDLQQGFPLLTTKKMHTRSIFGELCWFLRGDTRVDFLHEHGVKIWDNWLDPYGSIGPGYGKQWRRWEHVTLALPQHRQAESVTLDPNKVAGVGFGGESRSDNPVSQLLYATWNEMLHRCYDGSRRHREYYLDSGVHVDPRWFDFRVFCQDAVKLGGWFLKLEYPDQYSLDKDFHAANWYSPETCIWASDKEQNLNTSRSACTLVIRPDGHQFYTMDIAGTCEDYNLDKSTIYKCLRGERSEHKGWQFAPMVLPENGAVPRVRVYDQLRAAIAELKHNPMTRRAVVSAWNVADLARMQLPPCHYTFVFNVQNVNRLMCPTCHGVTSPLGDSEMRKITFTNNTVQWHCQNCRSWPAHTLLQRRELCLHWTQRSCDIALGVPFNIASYAALCHIVAREVGLPVGFLAGSFIDFHIYTKKEDGSQAEYDHVPGLCEQITRQPLALPSLKIIGDRPWDEVRPEDLVVEGYESHPSIAFKVAV